VCVCVCVPVCEGASHCPRFVLALTLIRTLYIYLYMTIYIYIYVYVYTCTCAHVCMCACMCACVHVCMCGACVYQTWPTWNAIQLERDARSLIQSCMCRCACEHTSTKHASTQMDIVWVFERTNWRCRVLEMQELPSVLSNAVRSLKYIIRLLSNCVYVCFKLRECVLP